MMILSVPMNEFYLDRGSIWIGGNFASICSNQFNFQDLSKVTKLKENRIVYKSYFNNHQTCQESISSTFYE